MKAEVISIGTEIVTGQSLDTNSQWLSQRLLKLGIPVYFHTSVSDALEDNLLAFRTALSRGSFLITTGGLGPTQDDLTRRALADVAGEDLELFPGQLAAIEAFFKRRNRAMTESNRQQAYFPKSAEPLPNPYGTAPGIWMKIGATQVACLPGVPSEMRRMFEEQVVPRLKSLHATERSLVVRKINLFGRGEADLERDALDLTARGRVPEVGITASEATISFRILSEGKDEREARAKSEETARLIHMRFADLVVGEEDEDVWHGLFRTLREKKATLATAESCTGGLIARLITSLPGASESFPGGVVAYANEVKKELLGVPEALLARVGAVSAEVAEGMAEGVRERFKSDIGLAVTGIAGPSGGSAEKPVGLVFLGLATADGVKSRRLELGPDQDRATIQIRSAKHAMNWARLFLLGKG